MVNERNTIAEIKELFPDVKITIVHSKDKGIGNPKKLADMKRVVSKIKTPLPTRE
ncbi:MAG: hypothetical protein ACHQD8_07770 [Chitinophagales bacterium]